MSKTVYAAVRAATADLPAMDGGIIIIYQTKDGCKLKISDDMKMSTMCFFHKVLGTYVGQLLGSPQIAKDSYDEEEG